MRKLVGFVTMLAIVLPTLFGTNDSVTAAEAKSVTFTLHKIVFPENGMPELKENDGDERLKEYDGLNGVTYDVYDVTKDFYQSLEGADGKDARDIQAELQGMELTGRAFVDQQVTATVNEEEGIARFILPKVSNGKDAVYLFRESAAPSDVKSKAADMIVALPVADSAGELLQDQIHLYPKNEIIQQPFEKLLVEQQPSYQFGDQIHYKLTTKLPSNLSMYSKYLISDQADETLSMNAQSLKVLINDSDYAGYQTEIAEHGFKLTFDLAKLKKYAGKEVTITYSMILSDKNKIDQEIINHAELETDFDKISRERKFKTGGKKFIKVDAEKSDRTLTEASFLVKNGQGEYLLENEAGYRWTKNRGTDNLVKLTSNKDGYFEIKGLRYGEYLLEEINAPIGYLLSKKDVPFEVSENSYSLSEGVLQVVNRRDSSMTKQPAKPSSTETKQQVTAKIPSMNDIQNLWLILVGGILVSLVTMIVIQRKTKRSE